MANSATVGALNVELDLNTAKFKAGAKSAQADLAGFAKGMNLAGVAAAGAGVAIAGAIAVFGQAQKAFAFADDIADTAAKLAVSTKALQEYRFAVHALGGTYEDADKALENFQKKFGAAQAKMSKEAVKPFEALGLDPSQFADWEDALDAVTESIGRLKSSAEQAAIAEKLGLSSMLPALRAGKDAIDEAREAANRLGFVMDDALIQKGGEANDRLEDLSQVLNVQLNSALVELAPLILNIADAFGDAAREVGDLAVVLGDLANWAQTDPFAKLVGRLLQVAALSTPGGAAAQAARVAAGYYADARAPLDPAFGMADDPAAIRMAMTVGANYTSTPVRDSSLRPPSERGRGRAKPNDRSQDAIEAAERDELEARRGLTENIVSLAVLRLQAVDMELAAKNRRLKEDQAEGTVSAAAAKIAAAKFAQAAADEKLAITRGMDARLAEEGLKQHGEIARFNDRIAAISADMAGTAEARAAIEKTALERRQAQETAELKQQLEQDVISGKKTAADRDWLLMAQRRTQAAEAQQQAGQAQAAIDQEVYDRKAAELALQIDLLESQADLAQTAVGRRALELRILALKQQEERAAVELVANAKDYSKYTKQQVEEAKRQLELMPQIHANQTEIARAGGTLADALDAMTSAVDDIAGAFSGHDWQGLFRGLDKAIVAAQRAFAAGAANGGGKFGGFMAAGTSVVGGIGQLIGGQTGNAISMGAGIAGLGIGLGSSAAALGSALSVGGALSSLGTLGIGSALSAIAPFLGPVGIIAGLAAALYSINKKPSNQGALATVDGNRVSLSGDKRTDETSQMATSAAEAILQGQEILRQAGITLGATIRSIDIGFRDATDIILSDGRALTSAVGDAAAAAETALRAIVEGATFVSDTQKALVESMMAAGQGFDAIATALQGFAQAQLLSKAIGDQILALTDPRGFALQQLEEAQKARRAEIEAAIKAGYLTADQFNALSAQLAQLEPLELAKVLEGFDDGADKAKDAVESLADAFNAQLSAVNGIVKQWGDIRGRLEDFRRSLTSGALSGATPQQALATARAAFLRAAEGARVGDLQALSDLPEAAQAFLDASKAAAPNAAAFAAALNEVKIAVGAASVFAGEREDMALQALQAINASIIGVRDAILLSAANDNGGMGAALPAFASGGSFRVGGFGGTDSSIVAFRATPGEMVDIHHGQREDGLAALASRIGRLEYGIGAIAGYTRSSAAELKRMQGGGLYVRGPSPDDPISTAVA